MTLPFPKPAKQPRSKSYRAAVRRLPCIGLTLLPGHVCPRTYALGGRIDAAHMGEEGHHMRAKASDLTVVPLDHHTHLQMHSLAGPFRGWTKAELRDWRVIAIRLTQDAMRKLGWDV